MEALTYYTVEITPPEDGWSRLPQLTDRARRASEHLRREGVEVRFLRAVFVPEEDACFYLYEAASADDVRQAVLGADLRCGRVAEAVPSRATDGERT